MNNNRSSWQLSSGFVVHALLIFSQFLHTCDNKWNWGSCWTESRRFFVCHFRYSSGMHQVQSRFDVAILSNNFQVLSLNWLVFRWTFDFPGYWPIIKSLIECILRWRLYVCRMRKERHSIYRKSKNREIICWEKNTQRISVLINFLKKNSQFELSWHCPSEPHQVWNIQVKSIDHGILRWYAFTKKRGDKCLPKKMPWLLTFDFWFNDFESFRLSNLIWLICVLFFFTLWRLSYNEIDSLAACFHFSDVKLSLNLHTH